MTLLGRMLLLEDENVAISATDTTPGHLEDKLAPGFGMESEVVDPAGSESLKVGLPSTIGLGKTFGTSGLLGKRQLAFDGTHFWGASPIPATPAEGNGYVRWAIDGTFLEYVEDFGDSRETDWLVYEATLDRLVAIRRPASGTDLYLAGLSKAIPSVKTEGTSITTSDDLVKAMTGGGYVWVHIDDYVNGYIYKVPADLSTNAVAHTIDTGFSVLMFDNTTTRYGDSEGRLFFSTSSNSTISRAIPSTDVVDDTFSPIASSGQIIRACVDETNGRIWAVWHDDTSWFIGSFDCEPLGSNLRSLDITAEAALAITTADLTYVSAFGGCLARRVDPATSICELQAYEDSGSAISPSGLVYGNANCLEDPGVRLSPSFVTTYTFFTIVVFAAVTPDGIFSAHGWGPSWGQSDFTPVKAGWVNNDYQTKLTSGDVPGYLGSKFAQPGDYTVYLTYVPDGSGLDKVVGSVIQLVKSTSLSAGTNDNVDPGSSPPWEFTSVLRLDSPAAAELTGLKNVLLVGNSIFTKKLFNVGSYNITLKHENAGSDAENRFDVPGGGDLLLEPGDSADIFGDVVTQRWRVC